jgi:hypothetical protein
MKELFVCMCGDGIPKLRFGAPLTEETLNAMRPEQAESLRSMFELARTEIAQYKAAGEAGLFIPSKLLEKRFHKEYISHGGLYYCPMAQLAQIFEFSFLAQVPKTKDLRFCI